MSTETAVTDIGRGSKLLPLHQRTELVRVQRTYFYCSNCGREHRFSWFLAYCNEDAELLCLFCRGNTELRLCRRCQRPRRLMQFGNAGTWPCNSSTCHDCQAVQRTSEPLQVVCAHCATTFAAKRSDAKFCSSRCRTATHRRGRSSTNSRDGGDA